MRTTLVKVMVGDNKGRFGFVVRMINRREAMVGFGTHTCAVPVDWLEIVPLSPPPNYKPK